MATMSVAMKLQQSKISHYSFSIFQPRKNDLHLMYKLIIKKRAAQCAALFYSFERLLKLSMTQRC